MKRTIDLIRANAREFDRWNGEGAALREALTFFAIAPVLIASAFAFLIMMGDG